MGELYNLSPKLPKNVRQIGERDQIVKLYVEDYVNTYLRRLYPSGGEDLRCGLLLGSAEEEGSAPYIFIDGALEMEGVSCGGERVDLNDQAWKKAYRDMEEMFPKRSVQGWFLCGAPGCQLSPLNYWKQHSRYFPGKNMIMYLNSGLEGEEAIYIASDDGFYKLRGYSIYYERNQMMQDYMIARKDVKRVDAGADDTVIRDFRRKMEENQEEARERRSTVSVLGSVCGVLSVAVLAGGIVMFNNYSKMKDMESVLASVLPAVRSCSRNTGWRRTLSWFWRRGPQCCRRPWRRVRGKLCLEVRQRGIRKPFRMGMRQIRKPPGQRRESWSPRRPGRKREKRRPPEEAGRPVRFRREIPGRRMRRRRSFTSHPWRRRMSRWRRWGRPGGGQHLCGPGNSRALRHLPEKIPRFEPGGGDL